MQITPIRTNNYNYNNTANSSRFTAKNQKTSFQGMLNERELKRVIELLSEKNSQVFENFNVNKFKEVMDQMTRYDKSAGESFLGMQIVPNDLLPLLLKNKMPKNSDGKIGLCIASGDKYGPIESWNKVYDAKTFIIHPMEFELHFQVNYN